MEFVYVVLGCILFVGVPMFVILYPICLLVKKAQKRAAVKRDAKAEALAQKLIEKYNIEPKICEGLSVKALEYLEIALINKAREEAEEKERYRRFFEVAQEFDFSK